MKYTGILACAVVVGVVGGKLVDCGIESGSTLTQSAARRVESEVVQREAIRETAQVAARAFAANAPHGYTPQTNACPSDAPTIRNASGLSPNETAWLEVRRQATIDPMKQLLARLNISGLDTDKYISDHQSNVSNLPNIGIALSGGGYRAMLNGAGVVQAFDSRTVNSTNAGHLGGLLQAATYLAGLSGGSWAVSSLYANNFSSVSDILASNPDDSDLWQLGNTIYEGPSKGSIQLLDSAGYYAALEDQVSGKEDTGFNTTITDYWGRALSYQIVNASDGGPAYTFSSIVQQDWFTSGSVPLPLVVADGRAPGEIIIPGNTTVFEFSPWELGTFDPTVAGFAPLKYVGSNFSAGAVRSTEACVTGFDNIGFVFGTSSSLFNTILTAVNGTNSTGLLSTALQASLTALLGGIGEADNDIADYPNPFYGWNNATNLGHVSQQLTLVDGGEDGQNIPLHPLVQPPRAVDVIFAVDPSADTNATLPTNASATGWPSGFAIESTYRRSLTEIQNGTPFPSIPDVNTFFNLGLNNRPTFFGCNSSNTTGGIAPLIVYLPNAPYVYTSNVSTFDLEYNKTERNAIVANGYNLATQGNGTVDPGWGTCVGCAILSRSLERNGVEVPEACTTCFAKYCWDGTLNETAPGSYVPEMKAPGAEIKVSMSGAGRITTSTAALLAVTFVVAVVAW
nr:hypothetical protein B0A51_12857 [Rachicladosporium sp. CCFEE 5018]